MKLLRNVLPTLVLAMAIGGCATSGPKFSEAAARPGTNNSVETARVYVYRTALYGVAVQPEVVVNGKVAGRAVPNGYFYVDLPPGPCEITTTTEVERKLSLTLDKGQTRYVKLNLGMGFFIGHVYAELIDDDIGRKEIQDLRYTGQ